MKSHEISLLANALKNQDLTLSLEIPLEPSESCSCSPRISLELDGTPLPTLRPPPNISGIFTKDSMIGSLDSQLMTGDQEMSGSG